MDPKQIVAQGYDTIAERYAEWAGRTRTDERERYTAVLLNALPHGATVLELGCGVGVPTTQSLARSFAVTGVDISAQHIALARRNVPAATFLQADMAALDFPPAGVDAVAAFYSVIYVPREEHAALLHDIATWLRPGGLLVATMGAGSTEATVEPVWLGVPMYFSHFDGATNRRLVEDAGLRIINAREETADEDGVPVTFLWVDARKPRALAVRRRAR
jgi:SAM-dependent methyltransferase